MSVLLKVSTPMLQIDIRKLSFLDDLKNCADLAIPSLLCLFLGIDDQIDLYNILPRDNVTAIKRTLESF